MRPFSEVPKVTWLNDSGCRYISSVLVEEHGPMPSIIGCNETAKGSIERKLEREPVPLAPSDVRSGHTPLRHPEPFVLVFDRSIFPTNQADRSESELPRIDVSLIGFIPIFPACLLPRPWHVFVLEGSTKAEHQQTPFSSGPIPASLSHAHVAVELARLTRIPDTISYLCVDTFVANIVHPASRHICIVHASHSHSAILAVVPVALHSGSTIPHDTHAGLPHAPDTSSCAASDDPVVHTWPSADRVQHPAIELRPIHASHQQSAPACPCGHVDALLAARRGSPGDAGTPVVRIYGASPPTLCPVVPTTTDAVYRERESSHATAAVAATLRQSGDDEALHMGAVVRALAAVAHAVAVTGPRHDAASMATVHARSAPSADVLGAVPRDDAPMGAAVLGRCDAVVALRTQSATAALDAADALSDRTASPPTVAAGGGLETLAGLAYHAGLATSPMGAADAAAPAMPPRACATPPSVGEAIAPTPIRVASPPLAAACALGAAGGAVDGCDAPQDPSAGPSACSREDAPSGAASAAAPSVVPPLFGEAAGRLAHQPHGGAAGCSPASGPACARVPLALHVPPPLGGLAGAPEAPRGRPADPTTPPRGSPPHTPVAPMDAGPTLAYATSSDTTPRRGADGGAPTPRRRRSLFRPFHPSGPQAAPRVPRCTRADTPPTPPPPAWGVGPPREGAWAATGYGPSYPTPSLPPPMALPPPHPMADSLPIVGGFFRPHCHPYHSRYAGPPPPAAFAFVEPLSIRSVAVTPALCDGLREAPAAASNVSDLHPTPIAAGLAQPSPRLPRSPPNLDVAPRASRSPPAVPPQRPVAAPLIVPPFVPAAAARAADGEGGHCGVTMMPPLLPPFVPVPVVRRAPGQTGRPWGRSPRPVEAAAAPAPEELPPTPPQFLPPSPPLSPSRSRTPPCQEVAVLRDAPHATPPRQSPPLSSSRTSTPPLPRSGSLCQIAIKAVFVVGDPQQPHGSASPPRAHAAWSRKRALGALTPPRTGQWHAVGRTADAHPSPTAPAGDRAASSGGNSSGNAISRGGRAAADLSPRSGARAQSARSAHTGDVAWGERPTGAGGGGTASALAVEAPLAKRRVILFE